MPLHFKPSNTRKPKAPKGAQRVRIIGGTLRSRVVTFADIDGLRPTANRVRETLFNWLGQTLQGKRCLDLFSGSGALGFEAASRGAAESVMLELERAAIMALQANQQKLSATVCRIVAMDALKFLDSTNEKFDIVFVDPPFASNLMSVVLQKLPPHLLDDAHVYAEWGAPIADVIAALPVQQWQIAKQGRAGAVHFALLRLFPIQA
jgi:16S rRNA (guanine966-N2)-methyltransferase